MAENTFFAISEHSLRVDIMENIFIFSGGFPHMNNNLDDLLTQLIRDASNSHHGRDELQTPTLTQRSGSIGYGGLTGDIHQRLANVRKEIKGLIVPARKSVQNEIAQNNRDKILLALVNFLGGKKVHYIH